MFDGIYSMTFRGHADWGMGMLIIQGGVITGADVAGGLYDGVYEQQGSDLLVTLTMTVPPGVALVQGTPAQPKQYSFPIQTKLPARCLLEGEVALLELPPGPVNV